jgi:hypothetical protein
MDRSKTRKWKIPASIRTIEVHLWQQVGCVNGFNIHVAVLLNVTDRRRTCCLCSGTYINSLTGHNQHKPATWHISFEHSLSSLVWLSTSSATCIRIRFPAHSKLLDCQTIQAVCAKYRSFIISQMKPTTTFGEKNADAFYVKRGGTYRTASVVT